MVDFCIFYEHGSWPSYYFDAVYVFGYEQIVMSEFMSDFESCLTEQMRKWQRNTSFLEKSAIKF